ncbi:AbaSI family restriction endonuclease [Savagea faecisuis]|uniref:AbaSI family restriction endonuclease n=1 Tax=Savagea faecisuis TaxID=1274803 RepID=A0ABW3GTG4_9BACL
MERRDYLIKTFSRTKRKDFENYILNAIWHRLDNPNIQPVSQQYVKRPNGSYALIDLYFPQLHIGIEVDEAHHFAQIDADQLRTEDILTALEEDANTLKMDHIIGAVEENSTSHFQIFRIDATLPLHELHQQIDQVVHHIQQKANTRELQWLTYEEELERVKRQTSLSINDAVAFKYIRDIANTVFGKNNKANQQSYFKVTDEITLWCPQLSPIIDGEVRSMAGGWLNFLADDWSYIDESNKDVNTVDERLKNLEKKQKEDRTLAVFAKFKDNLGINRYRFVGMFKLAGISPDDDRFLRYVKIGDSVPVTQ